MRKQFLECAQNQGDVKFLEGFGPGVTLYSKGSATEGRGLHPSIYGSNSQPCSKEPRNCFVVWCVNMFKLIVPYRAFEDLSAMRYSFLFSFINAPKERNADLSFGSLPLSKEMPPELLCAVNQAYEPHKGNGYMTSQGGPLFTCATGKPF
ncbi:hypothetical protein A6R68_18486 [Neotoma lepida]|uniref:Uncharacterized protein n=1 Tax=Neotoma lepida TaxID=56216 RepID=A0A1A6HLF6_NEOLE|nr:hypothetical protein A6R68_18486 [Neotoma lepida]